jgi:hypothetical protein
MPDLSQAFLSRRHFAQRAFWAATILLRAAADMGSRLRVRMLTTL